MTIDTKDKSITTKDRIMLVLRQAGAKGLRPSEIAEAVGKSHDATRLKLRTLMQRGKAARVIHSRNRTTMYAIEYAPSQGTTPPPAVKAKKRTAADEALEILAQAGAEGISAAELAHRRGTTQASAYETLKFMTKIGKCVNRRPSYKVSRYYLFEHAPAVSVPAVTAQLQPSKKYATTISAPSRTLFAPDAVAIITDCTKITSVKAPLGRFEFEPPPGWKGQITRDWQDRRLREIQQ